MANMRLLPGKALKLLTSLSTADLVPVASISARDRLLIRCCILAIAALAWAYLFYLDHQMSQAMTQETMSASMEMPGMPMTRPWAGAEVFFTFVMWAVMMAGMMAGSAMPVMLLFAGAHARRGERAVRQMTLLFGVGYAVVWIGFSALATLTQWALHDAAMLSPMMAASSPQVGAAILCAAGVYQLTPFKQTCLTHCRSALGFFMTHWRDGRFGALQMGLRHGAYCLGCCWAVMLVLFVVGVMNLVWVAALALLLLLEKVGPAGLIVARVAGVAMIVAGIFLIIGI
jgi:predicted metal-binding membrane protein